MSTAQANRVINTTVHTTRNKIEVTLRIEDSGLVKGNLKEMVGLKPEQSLPSNVRMIGVIRQGIRAGVMLIDEAGLCLNLNTGDVTVLVVDDDVEGVVFGMTLGE